ncbi:MAG: hypothetical protein EOM28_09420 [Clostridia bacterium]|nr:hypothetical protein [Clostridia bacterium]
MKYRANSLFCDGEKKYRPGEIVVADAEKTKLWEEKGFVIGEELTPWEKAAEEAAKKAAEEAEKKAAKEVAKKAAEEAEKKAAKEAAKEAAKAAENKPDEKGGEK